MHVAAIERTDIHFFALELRLAADDAPDPAEVGPDPFLLAPILLAVRQSSDWPLDLQKTASMRAGESAAAFEARRQDLEQEGMARRVAIEWRTSVQGPRVEWSYRLPALRFARCA